MRPVLHRIMQSRVRAIPVAVRLRLTVTSLENLGTGVDVGLSDGTTGRYDLVIGADSVYSAVRDIAFPDMGPAMSTGQGCWRISIRKPPGLEMGEFFLGHANPCGITACGPDNVYMWMLTSHERRKEYFSDEELYTNLKALLADFGGNASWICDNMSREDWINYRPLTTALQPRPWFNGRIVLLGDAVHATTPHLASGAGMAVESAIVRPRNWRAPPRWRRASALIRSAGLTAAVTLLKPAWRSASCSLNTAIPGSPRRFWKAHWRGDTNRSEPAGTAPAFSPCQALVLHCTSSHADCHSR